MFGGEAPLTHRQLAEDAAGAAVPGDGIALPPLAERAGLSRLLAAVDAGRTMVARSLFAQRGRTPRHRTAVRPKPRSACRRRSMRSWRAQRPPSRGEADRRSSGQHEEHAVPDMRKRAIRAGLETLYFTGTHRLARSFFAGMGAILTFHRVLPPHDEPFQPHRGLEITPDFLDAVLTALAPGRCRHRLHGRGLAAARPAPPASAASSPSPSTTATATRLNMPGRSSSGTMCR